MMADLDFEQIDRSAIQYLREHLDPSFIKEYEMDLCDEYSEGMDDEEGFLDIDEMADFVSGRLSQDMGVKMHEDDAYDLISTLYDYYAEQGLVDILDADEDQE